MIFLLFLKNAHEYLQNQVYSRGPSFILWEDVLFVDDVFSVVTSFMGNVNEIC